MEQQVLGRGGGADDPAVDRDDRLLGVDLHTEPRRLAVDGDAAVGDEDLARPAEATPDAARTFWRRSAAISRALREAVVAGGREQRVGDRLAALLGEPRRDVAVERRQLVQAGQPEPLEELEPGAVQERPAGRLGSSELDDEPAMQQRPDRVVGIDAADALDRGLRDRLAIGDDGQRLERRRGQPDGVRADIAGDEGAALGGGGELDPVAVDEQADAALAERNLEVAQPGVDGRPVRAGEGCDLAPRQRLLGDEQERLEGGLGQLDRGGAAPRLAASAALGAAGVSTRLGGVRLDGVASRERLQRSRRAARRRPSTPAAARSCGRRRAGDDRAPRRRLLDDDLASLHELEHGQERDRDDDPVADPVEQVLEHDRRGVAQGRPDDRRPAR